MPNLTGITALDVAIGLTFVYLLFSLLCAVVVEGISGILDLRARTLEKGLRNLLDDDGTSGFNGAPSEVKPASGESPPAGQVVKRGESALKLSDEVLGHGLIRTQYQHSRLFFKRQRRGPSYLPPRMFALALLDVVAPEPSPGNPMPRLQTSIANSDIPQGTKNALLALAKDAGDDRDRLRERVERWFDGSMDRVTGWYKRRSQLRVYALSALVAIGLNVNSIAIADRLVRDDAVRTAVVARAIESLPAQPDDPNSVRAAVMTEAPKTSPGQDRSMNEVADEIAKVKKLGIPIGWNLAKNDPARPSSDHLARTVGGWLITFLALSLGAPFWFDALSRLAGLRSAGARPKAGAAGPTANPA